MKSGLKKILLFTYLLYLFRFVVGKYLSFGEFFFIIPPTFYLIINASYFRNYQRELGYLLIWNFIIIIELIINIVAGYDIITSALAAVNYTFSINFWILVFLKEKDKNWVLNSLNIMVVLFSILALIQFFFYPELFGLISESIYSNEKNIDKITFSKRAISIIKSPQSLAFVLTLYLLSKSPRNILQHVLVIAAGILTFSKSFFMGLAINKLLRIKLRSIFYITTIFSLFLISLYQFSEISGVDRITSFVFDFSLDSQSDRLERWYHFVTQFLSGNSLFFGNGLGSAARFSSATSISSESFLIQLLYETGIFGIILFLYPYLLFILRKKADIPFVVAFFLLIFVSPSFYGISINFLVYPLLISKYYRYI